MAQEEFVPADKQSGFLGWRICAAAVLTQAVAIGFTLGSVGVFAAPLAEELGATATQFNLAVSLFSLVMNLSMPIIGGFLDRGSADHIRAVQPLFRLHRPRTKYPLERQRAIHPGFANVVSRSDARPGRRGRRRTD